ncbi:hypothetical protein OJ997_16825 [Solirubrobacter phytolaccae]|uniref:DoxX family membrane protein n=1 Tax=Solirubrobacter phytolaccae TaxID=1404360 RepID=A0A9X3SBY9_9ACTN|nr:hypothetical protein [Solirubrobacter phytolaccae]MDA0181970.1 hypothetical protein [Solirubrobacter phytolaccae]
MSRVRAAAQVLLGAAMAGAGTTHLTTAREEFKNQVPPWVPVDADLVVLASGVVEIGLGAAMLATWKQPKRALVGATLAAFYIAIFPGNIAQYTEHRDAFGLDTDTKRLVRLFFQPLLVLWALEATDARRVWRARRG